MGIAGRKMTSDKSPDQLAREDIERRTLEAAAKLLEETHTNRIYKAAWRAAAKMVRQLKPI